MAELTKEYFDKKLGGLEKGLKSYVDKKIDEVKAHTEKQVEELAHFVAKGFDDISKRLDMSEKIEELEKRMMKIEEVLNVN